MSKLDDLIQQYCPNGVFYKCVGALINEKSVISITPSIKIKRNDYREQGKTPIISQEIEFISGYCDIEDARLPQAEYVCFGDHSEHIKYIDFAFVQGADGLKIMGIDSQKLLAKYFYYAISNNYKRHDNYERHFKYLSETMIPVPPLEVQGEIVRILDNFTELTTELTDELTARKKQFEYYLNLLFSENNSYPVRKLGDFSQIVRGGNFQKKDFIDHGYPCIHYGQMYTHLGVNTFKAIKYLERDVFLQSKRAVKNDIIMAVTSENVEDVCKCTAWLGDEEIAVSGHTAIIHHNQNASYLSYFFRTILFFEQKKRLAHGTKVIEVTPNKLNDILVPLPSLEEQEKIVTILNRFDKLCNDIFEGLPAEIAWRQKQYEYYRDKLLTFSEFCAETE